MLLLLQDFGCFFFGGAAVNDAFDIPQGFQVQALAVAALVVLRVGLFQPALQQCLVGDYGRGHSGHQ